MQRRSVALLIETSNAYARGLLHGIIEYQRRHDAWSIYLPEQDRGASPPRWIRNWHGDGLIARIETDEIARVVQQIGIPVVDVSAARKMETIPWVETDDAKVAELAASHLVERGFQNFAFCGVGNFNWSVWRLEAFDAVLKKHGFACNVFESSNSRSHGKSWPQEKRRMATWLRSLPKPIGDAG